MRWKFFPSKTEKDIWMHETNGLYKYIGVYVDDLIISALSKKRKKPASKKSSNNKKEASGDSKKESGNNIQEEITCH
jgi:hypothetical protein